MNGLQRVRRLTCVLLLFLLGCGEAAPREGGTVVIASGSDLDFANPLVSVEKFTGEILRYVLFTPLIRYGPELDYQPALAESWELEGDTAVVFHLRRDVRWHDGRPTTAHDVLFTYERAADPATAFPNADYFSNWTGGAVVDSYTVRFTFEPHAEALGGLPFTPVVPEHVLDTVPPEALRQTPFNADPVGNGPFRFVSRRAGDRWIFERNPDYPEGLGGPARLDRLVWRVVPNSSAQIAELVAGEADLVVHPQPGALKEMADRPGIRVVLKPSRQFSFVVWNESRSPLDRPSVRRALTLAIDRQEILDGLRGGLGELGVGPIGPFHWAWDEGLEPPPFDPDSARALLDVEGIRDRDGDGVRELPDGGELTIELKFFSALDYYRDAAEAIRDDLAAIGVEVSTRPTEPNTLFADVTSPDRRFDAAILGWSADIRLDLRDLFHSDALDGPYQFAQYGNPEVDSLIDRATMETRRDRARPLWYRVQEILLEEQPWTVLNYQTDALLARERVRALETDIRGVLVNVADWWVASGEPEGDAPQEDIGG